MAFHPYRLKASCVSSYVKYILSISKSCQSTDSFSIAERFKSYISEIQRKDLHVSPVKIKVKHLHCTVKSVNISIPKGRDRGGGGREGVGQSYNSLSSTHSKWWWYVNSKGLGQPAHTSLPMVASLPMAYFWAGFDQSMWLSSYVPHWTSATPCALQCTCSFSLTAQCIAVSRGTLPGFWDLFEVWVGAFLTPQLSSALRVYKPVPYGWMTSRSASRWSSIQASLDHDCRLCECLEGWPLQMESWGTNSIGRLSPVWWPEALFSNQSLSLLAF